MSNINLRKLSFSPNENPLLVGGIVPIRQKRVRAALSQRQLVDVQTGEVVVSTEIWQTVEQDDAQFVKVFAAGVAATYELSRTGARVFAAVLAEYERAPLVGGYVASIALAWLDNGLSGHDIGMSEKTFQRGLKELLARGFLYPRLPNVYWVNPALFFKGDRAVFVREYIRKRPIPAIGADPA
jgi:hypothetical protein